MPGSAGLLPAGAYQGKDMGRRVRGVESSARDRGWHSSLLGREATQQWGAGLPGSGQGLHLQTQLH